MVNDLWIKNLRMESVARYFYCEESGATCDCTRIVSTEVNDHFKDECQTGSLFSRIAQWSCFGEAIALLIGNWAKNSLSKTVPTRVLKSKWLAHSSLPEFYFADAYKRLSLYYETLKTLKTRNVS